MFNRYQTGGLQHLTARLVRDAIGEELFRRCYKFAVCRDPLKRLISQFRYMALRQDLKAFAGLKSTFSFSDYLDRISSVEHVQWKPQSAFLTDLDGTLLVDEIFRLEVLSENASALARMVPLGVSKLPHRNQTRASPFPVLTEDEKRRVWEMYDQDYRLLGYPKT